ncbi:MarR family transcriptional regulator [Natrinema halophilum]|uniref:MarR family transcriptional regulator n=1 Tax=Natrinema halophilum TaxID=1699371 RepID=UPI001F24394F|nr:helix-turn-helix domain-containing protein [Natrinema halophilum]UHQ96147.1 winged helix-turn-helix transcriptional regulator [Natrinema halophilum]
MNHTSDQLYELSPSAKLVYKVLEVNGTMTQSQIADESLLSKRTVRYAIGNLREADLLHERVSFRDARKTLYSISESIAADEIARVSE